MIGVEINAGSVKEIAKQLHNFLGGHLEEKWGELTLYIDNDLAEGQIRFVNFDWGINLIELNILFKDIIILELDTTRYNPIKFMYCLSGQCQHGFNSNKNMNPIEQYQSVIISNKAEGKNLLMFPKNLNIEMNIIDIFRKQFVKKRLNNLELLNKELYAVFMDDDHENRYAFFGNINLVLADQVRSFKNIRSKGLARLLQIEARVYMILSLHFQQHNLEKKGIPKTSSLSRKELAQIRKIASQIIKNPAKPYNLSLLSRMAALPQAKLQNGFKTLFNRTVTEFIRSTRLKAARELMHTTDLNISEIVYEIGFTSRSYFSKIFKEQYEISPNLYKKQITRLSVA